MKTISESIPDLNFIEINREERNHVAILYHLLLSGNNLQKFLKISGITGDFENSEIELYFEYALLRDFWERIKKDDEGNTDKKAYLFAILKDSILDKDKLDSFDTDTFNSYFGAKRAQSKTIIASPANWSIASFDSEILTNKDFLKAVCMLKWSFNAKPDIVIHLPCQRALCIEAKFKSGEGLYPTNESEGRIFQDIGLDKVKQTEVQRYLMEEILGFRTDYRYLTIKPGRRKRNFVDEELTWRQLADSLSTEGQSKFVKNWVELWRK